MFQILTGIDAFEALEKPSMSAILKKQSWRPYVLVIFLMGLMGLLLLRNAQSDSATADEPIHILSGYEYWNGIFTVNPEHPPLGKLIDAVPLVFIRPILPFDSEFTHARDDFYYDSWAETKAYARKWLYGTRGNNPEQIVFTSRIAVVIFTLILGWIVFMTSKRWYGQTAALIAVFLFALSPILLTHGHLANTDLWAALGFYLGVFSFGYFLNKPTGYRMIFAAICFSAAMLLKFSTLVLIPIFALLWLTKYFLSKRDRSYSWKRALLTTLVFAVVASCCIWANYGFPTAAAPRVNLQAHQVDPSDPLMILAPLFQHLPVPLYFKGLAMTLTGAFSDREAYCLGRFYAGGVWYYFPLAVLVKEPLALLIMFFGGIISWVVWRKKLEFRDWLLIIPTALYFCFSLTAQLNVGIRHLLPIYPFLFIFIGYSVSEFISHRKLSPRNKIFTSYLPVALLFGWYLYAALSVYPYFMTYFNELAGGPRGGSRILADSNIDWGQDMKRVAGWIKEQHLSEPVKMDYFWSGTIQPQYYGINFIPLQKDDPSQKGWIIIGVTSLQRPEFKWLQHYPPLKIIGNSVFVFLIR